MIDLTERQEALFRAAWADPSLTRRAAGALAGINGRAASRVAYRMGLGPKATVDQEWKPERVELLKDLRATGLSASQVAGKMGKGLTRNAVIGKLRRLNIAFSRPSKPKRIAKPKASGAQRRKHSNFVAINMSNQAIRAQAKAFGETRVPPAEIRACANQGPASTGKGAVIRAPKPPAFEPPGRCTILTIGRGMCRWPIGDPAEPSFTLCGREAERTYCAGHAEIAYQPRKAEPARAADLPSPRRRAA